MSYKHKILSGANKPAPMPPVVENSPDALKQRNQWVVWSWRWVGSKWDKPPLQVNGQAASVSDPTTWATFDDALQAQRAGGFDGVGFVFTDGDDFFGFDFDDAIGEGG